MIATSVGFRFMGSFDYDAVLEIENVSFKDPWKKEDFNKAMRHKNVYSVVIEIDKKIIAGYAVYKIEGDFIEVANFAVHPDHRRQGIATQIMEMLFEKMGHKREKILMYVADYNLDAHLFLRALGFKAVKVERSFYTTKEDAYLFEKVNEKVNENDSK